MQETLLDFDNADASGDRGAVIPLKSEDRRQKIAHSRNVRYAARMVDAESSRPGPELSNGAAAGTRAFRVERTHREKARNEKAVKSLKINDPAKSLIRRS